MIKTAEYLAFEEGFLKEAVAQGLDVGFLMGMIKEADEAHEKWAAAIDEMEKESEDPLFRLKIAFDLAELALQHQLTKQANPALDNPDPALAGMVNDARNSGNWANDIQNGIGSLAKSMNMPRGLVATGGGGIGGGLLGLIIGQLLGNPLLGIIIGSLGGAGVGALLNSGWFKQFGNDVEANVQAANEQVSKIEAEKQNLPRNDTPPAGTPEEQAASLNTMGNRPQSADSFDPELAANPEMASARENANQDFLQGEQEANQANQQVGSDFMSGNMFARPHEGIGGALNSAGSLVGAGAKPIDVPKFNIPQKPVMPPSTIKQNEALLGNTKLAVHKILLKRAGLGGMTFNASPSGALAGPQAGAMLNQGVPTTTAENPLLPPGALVPQQQAMIQTTAGSQFAPKGRPIKQVF